MAYQAQHAQVRKSAARRSLPLLGLAAAGAGVVAAPAAHAATRPAAPDPVSQYAQMQDLRNVPLYPLAGTPLDLLSNNLHMPVGGMDVSTYPVTEPFKDGLPLGDLPVVGAVVP